MYTGRLVFSQVMGHLPLHVFHQCVDRYRCNFKVKEFTCLDQYFCMAFAQMTDRESLRDIVACLRPQNSKHYHMGIRGPVSRNTLANANNVRYWRIYTDLAHSLFGSARKLYLRGDFGLEPENTVYALDATTIDLCPSMFPWVAFRQSKGAIKLYTLLDLRGNIPAFIHISDGKLLEVNTLDLIPIEAGAFYVMDRGYLDFARLHALSQASAFFVIRAKSNFRYRRIYSHPVDQTTGLICDQSVILSGFYPSKNYPDKLRRVKYYDASTGKNVGISDQQFHPAAPGHCRPLSTSLAGRTVLQMDQAESPHQDLLWHVRESFEGADLDCSLGLCARGHHEEKAPVRDQPLYNATDSQRQHLRQNAHISDTCRSQ